MHILITGAAGMIGRKLTARLVADGALNGPADRPAHAPRRERPATPENFRRASTPSPPTLPIRQLRVRRSPAGPT
jgi:nucleoside-diphosphate-sugar epimerase